MDYNKDELGQNTDQTNSEAPLGSAPIPQARRRTVQQIRRDRMQAIAVMIVFGLIVAASVIYFVTSGNNNDDGGSTVKTDSDRTSSGVSSEISSAAPEKDSSIKDSRSEEESRSEIKEAEGHEVEVIDGRTYIDGILIVNKTYSIPRTYAPGMDSAAEEAFYNMAGDAYADGIVLYICSGYRSYDEQEQLYNSYAAERGVEEADEVSSRPGHSEHQSGLCMDVNTTEFSFEGTPEAIWLEEHCADYGFIIRFPKGKESITGYAYEPWHIRYVGEAAAKEITAQDICLEEYLDVTSDYANAQDAQS
ncbi:M15 family metallopeptidase [Ruminococcus sp. Marseille-P6503]|uniref:M15 family metallopeptidase n=1 Tax=Ruminococcus sp. Marseille-P6503 TaxID=2364796 RepID=UPI000F545842|nr:M15 family metallopeptidase [Ruminococcus sp. Marseille-P6503]